MTSRTFARATPAHVGSLADAIRGLIPGSFHIIEVSGAVVIETASWDGVDTEAVQLQVTAAPDDTDTVRAKYEADAIPVLLKAALLSLLDGLNMERARHGVAAITPAQFVAAIRAKVDSLK